MQSESDDPARLLTEAGQWTEPWGGSEDGQPCDKCDGAGHTHHTCWSCVLTGARDDCPLCGGRVRWDEECPVCRGTARIDGKPRHGVSVFPTVEGLYHYMLAKKADVESCTIVELDAERAEDVDFDADQGAMLVIPTAVLACHEVDRRLVAELERRTAEHAPD